MDRWAGKVAIVTGVSSGIGEAIARQLVAKGMKVAGLARRIEKIKVLEQELKGSKGEFKGIKCDVTDAKQVESAFKWVDENWGAVGVLINNAAVLKLFMISDGNTEDIQQTFNTNVVAATCCAKLAVKSMKKSNDEGCIININSTAGHSMPPFPGIGGYTSSKFALTVVTEYLRNELAMCSNKIRVTSLSPGLVETEMSAQFSDKIRPGTPILKANEVAECVLLVLSASLNVNITELTVQPTGESLMKMF